LAPPLAPVRVGYDGSESARRALQCAAAHAGDQTLLVVVPAFEPYPRRGSRSQPTSTVLSSNGAGTTSMTRGRCCPSAGYEWRHCSCEVIRRPYSLATGRSLIHRGAALRPTQGQVHAQPELVSTRRGMQASPRKRWWPHPMVSTVLLSNAVGVQRTRRQASLVQATQTALRQRRRRRTDNALAGAPAIVAAVSDPEALARWEHEGGAVDELGRHATRRVESGEPEPRMASSVVASPFS